MALPTPQRLERLRAPAAPMDTRAGPGQGRRADPPRPNPALASAPSRAPEGTGAGTGAERARSAPRRLSGLLPASGTSWFGYELVLIQRKLGQVVKPARKAR